MGAVIGILVVLALVATIGSFIVGLDSHASGAKLTRAEKKHRNAALISKTKQLNVAQTALVKIASDDSGIPKLDAQNALAEISNLNIKELEN